MTQLHYAKQGIITPEMEFVAIRENMKLQTLAETLSTSLKNLVTPSITNTLAIHLVHLYLVR